MISRNLQITPLGAAIVEALPDRERVKKIQRDFRRGKLPPVSEIFPTVTSVREFYGRNIWRYLKSERVKQERVNDERDS